MRILSCLVLAVAVFSFSCCKKSDKPDEAQVTFKFENFVDQQKIETSSTLNYTNAAGNQYNVSLMKYYVSYVVLEDADGNKVELKNHNLMDAFGNSQMDPVTLPNGNYVKMSFIYGVNSENNTSGDQSGDLDPSQNMFWSWASGYIFGKHEGKYMDASNTEKGLVYHFGGEGNQLAVTINNMALNVDGTDKEAFIKYNLNNMYNNPVIDFNDDDFTHSGASDATLVNALKANIGDVFSFTGSNDL
jgi:hypothetical protein